MKHFNQISKILLIVLAIVGLAIGMSSIAGYNNSSANVNTTISTDNNLNYNIMDSKCGAGKCGGDETEMAVSDEVDEVETTVSNEDDEGKAVVKEAKCGEGKCGEGKCGGDDSKTAIYDKVDEAEPVISNKVDEAKCGVGKCG